MSTPLLSLLASQAGGPCLQAHVVLMLVKPLSWTSSTALLAARLQVGTTIIRSGRGGVVLLLGDASSGILKPLDSSLYPMATEGLPMIGLRLPEKVLISII